MGLLGGTGGIFGGLFGRGRDNIFDDIVGLIVVLIVIEFLCCCVFDGGIGY